MGASIYSEPTVSLKMTMRLTAFTSLMLKPTTSPAILVTLIQKNMNFKKGTYYVVLTLFCRQKNIIDYNVG